MSGEPSILDLINNTPRPEAIEMLQTMRGAHPEPAKLDILLGKLLISEKRIDEAQALLHERLDADPTQRQAAVLLTETYLRADNVEAAEAVWPATMAAFPEDATLRTSVASFFAQFGAVEAAGRFIDQAEPLEDNPATIAHFRAALSGETPENPDMSHVRDLFDRVAHKYDSSLQGAKNRGPEIAQMMLNICGISGHTGLRTLDAGCGTGLCGPMLRPMSSELIGVDLSQQMLDIAAQTGAYDALATADISSAANLPDGTFNLILCTDVLVYFGDLNAVLKELASKLKPAGWLVFSVEAAPEDLGDPGYQLEVSGRYKHSEDHAQQAILGAGLNVVTFAETPDMRIEMHQPVAAHVAVCQKPLPQL